MIHIVYPYRNRDLKRIRFSLNSLAAQNNTNFRVHFVDYGSTPERAKEVKIVVESYDFVTYRYVYCPYTMWNKSHALNIVLKELADGHFFVADVDGIFHPELVQTLHNVAAADRVTYFQVGFLTEEASREERPFETYPIKFLSTYEATGLSLFPVKALKEIKGFNEYYHLWGSEDTDVHVRCKHHGLDVQFFDETLLILHQWHTIYRALDDKRLTDDITIRNISRLNMYYLKDLKESNQILANEGFHWGNDITKSVQQCFEKQPDRVINVSLNKTKRNAQLASIATHTNQMVRLQWHRKKLIVSRLKSLAIGMQWEKHVSDSILKFHIEVLRDKPYQYKVDPVQRTFTYTVQL
ncbi:glycosyltransferase family 2 protein [Dokdonia sp. Hel_I_53]|uniref:glycosyltransferase family 2 protein n=1 Tax=Dokdonia sp. Hel_I_53 TaxID=1566287 RepID=UPI00119B823B|nr:glycosyltransferase family 2 protein [Dokdonia sp. Hel_I_53]TVZ53391.1 glycosyl transferase family 2 [Dokdonia sp. Hel_I_53]